MLVDNLAIFKYKYNKNLCGRDGRTICGPAEKYMCVIVIR